MRTQKPMEFTDKIVASLPIPAKSAKFHRETGGVKRFGVRVTPAGSRAFAIRYYIGGTERLFTIGAYPTWSTAPARAEAKRLLRLVDQGRDPLAEREAERSAPTVADLAKRYEEEHLPGKRQRSAEEDRALIKGYILPALGRVKVADVHRADVARLHCKVTEAGKPVRANRALACLRTVFACAVAWGLRPDNPARGGRGGVAMNPEDGRERFLSPAEIARLSEVLDRYPERNTAALVKFLTLTGCRFGEAAAATWDEVDLERGVWVKPSSHTKAKRQHAVPLSAPALALLAGLRRGDNSPLVFPSPKTGRPLVTVKTAWARIRRDAGLPGVRIHDLRHSFASVLASSGASLQLIGSLLGHAQVATTSRYAHLADDARREAVERVGAAIAGGGPSAEVVELRRAR